MTHGISAMIRTDRDLVWSAAEALEDYDYMSGLTMLDVSRWQMTMDFDQSVSSGAIAVCMRATVGNYYTDPEFSKFWDNAKAAGLQCSAYHVVTPEYTAESQMDRFIDVFAGRTEDFPVVLDCELTRDQSSSTITNNIKKCADILEGFGFPVMIYTSPGFWNHNVERRDYWKRYPLWVAHYTAASYPLIPEDWNQWDLWQWTSKGDGATWGASSNAIDLNRVRDPDFFDTEPPSNGNGGNGVTNKYFDEAVEQAEICELKGLKYILELPVLEFSDWNGDNGDPGNGDNGGNGDNDNGDEPDYPADAEKKVIDTYEFDHAGVDKDKEPFVYKFVSWKKTIEEKPPYGVWNIAKVKVGNSIWKLPVGKEVMVSAHKQPVSPDEMCLHNLVHTWYDHEQDDAEVYLLDVGNCKKA